MKILNLNDFKNIENNDKVYVSIYMPTHRIGSEAEQDPIRFKNYLREAEDKLDEDSISISKEEFFKEAKELLDNEDFWQHGLGSLLVVISEDETYVLDRPAIIDEYRETLFIGDKPYLLPLFDKTYLLDDYYIVDIASDRYGLYTFDESGLEEIDPEHIENRESELATASQDVEGELESTVGANAGYSGTHSEDEVEKREGEEYIRYALSQISEYLNTVEDRNVLLFGTDKNVKAFKELAEKEDLDIYHTFEKPLDSIDKADLVGEIYDDLRDQYVSYLRDEIENIKSSVANGLGATDLKEIEKANEFGAIETLYIDRDYDDIASKDTNDLVFDVLNKDGNIVVFDTDYNVWPASVVAVYRFDPYQSPENN